MRLLLLFILVPFVELFLLLKLAEWTSGGFAFALVILTGIVGASLARRQGWSVIARLRSELEAGQLPTTTLTDALMIFVAGALLITPGVLTDVFGFSLLIPICRNFYRQVVLKWLRAHVTVVTSRGYRTEARYDDETLDAEVISRSEREEHGK